MMSLSYHDIKKMYKMITKVDRCAVMSLLSIPSLYIPLLLWSFPRQHTKSRYVGMFNKISCSTSHLHFNIYYSVEMVKIYREDLKNKSTRKMYNFYIK